MDIFHNLILGFQVAYLLGESPLLFHRGVDRDADRGAAGDRSDDGGGDPDPDHLRDERNDGDHHDGRGLLRGDVRGIDDVDPDQRARGVRLGDDHAGRLSDGQKGKAGAGAGDGGPGVVHRGNLCRHHADVDRAPSGELCRLVRSAGVFCPDVHGTHAGDLAWVAIRRSRGYISAVLGLLVACVGIDARAGWPGSPSTTCTCWTASVSSAWPWGSLPSRRSW